jgi:TetR/AcrR family transcriptional regulator
MSVAARRERERGERRSLILDAAERAFAAKGLDATTMDDIAAQAQLAKGTLYLYFDTKEELLLGMAVRHQRAVLDRFAEAKRSAANGYELVGKLLLLYAANISSSRDHLRMVMSRWVNGVQLGSSPCALELREAIQHIYEGMCSAVADGQGDGSIRADIPPPRAATILWSAVNGRLLLELQARAHHCSEQISGARVAGGLATIPTMEEHVGVLLEAIHQR